MPTACFAKSSSWNTTTPPRSPSLNVEENSVVAIRPKPAFHPIFEVAIARKGSGIALINQTPQTQDEPEASESCSWWRRGRVFTICKHH